MPRHGTSLKNSRKTSKLSEVFFSIGLLIAVIGAGKYTLATGVQTKQVVAFPGSITERRLAITNAVKNGSSDYNFAMNFIPGIGMIVNPGKYRDEILNQLQNSTEANNL